MKHAVVGRPRSHAIDLSDILKPAPSMHSIPFNQFKACHYKVKKIQPLETIPEDQEGFITISKITYVEYNDSIWDWPS